MKLKSINGKPNNWKAFTDFGVYLGIVYKDNKQYGFESALTGHKTKPIFRDKKSCAELGLENYHMSKDGKLFPPIKSSRVARFFGKKQKVSPMIDETPSVEECLKEIERIKNKKIIDWDETLRMY